MVYRTGFVGNIIQVPEFLIHDPDLKLEVIICEKNKFNDDLLTFSLVRNIKIYPIEDITEIKKIFENIKDIDFFVMCSFGRKITQDIFTKADIYNIHYSKLPYYRGRHPTFWATVESEKELGISIHKVSEKYDEGDIISQRTVPYYFWMSEEDIFNDLTEKVPDLINDLKEYFKGSFKAKKNVGGNYYKPVSEIDYVVDLLNDSPNIVFNKVRSQKRYNGAKILLKNNTLWVKEIRFTDSTGNLQTGELYFSNEGHLCVQYKDQIAIKCLNYNLEEGNCR